MFMFFAVFFGIVSLLFVFEVILNLSVFTVSTVNGRFNYVLVGVHLLIQQLVIPVFVAFITRIIDGSSSIGLIVLDCLFKVLMEYSRLLLSPD